MDNNAVLITYSAKGDVKRALREAGFNVTRKAGPPGKRHITIARKLLFN
ncbi:MAG: MnmC family methyltransferase [Bacteroidales bacterium]